MNSIDTQLMMTEMPTAAAPVCGITLFLTNLASTGNCPQEVSTVNDSPVESLDAQTSRVYSRNLLIRNQNLKFMASAAPAVSNSLRTFLLLFLWQMSAALNTIFLSSFSTMDSRPTFRQLVRSSFNVKHLVSTHFSYGLDYFVYHSPLKPNDTLVYEVIKILGLISKFEIASIRTVNHDLSSSKLNERH